MMRRVIFLNLLVVTIAAASVNAQQTQIVAPAGSALEPTESSVAPGPLFSASLAQQRPPAAPPPPPRPRRRGSMVGYIEDPVIESKIRVRFDTAWQNTVPDRAEFFYAKCGCYRDVPPTDPAFDPEAPGPHAGAANDINFQQLYIYGEYAFSDRVSAFGQLPFRWLQPQSFIPGTGPGFSKQSGVEDIRAGVKAGLVATDVQSFTAQVRVFFPTGDSTKGLGTDHTSIEPALLYFQDVNDVVSFESQVGVWLPFDGAAPVPTAADGTFAGDVLFYGFGPSFTVYRTDRVRLAPVVELVGWRVINGNQTAAVADASGTNIVNLKLGARTVFSGGSFYAGYGFALTDDTWYDDVLRLEYRIEF